MDNLSHSVVGLAVGELIHRSLPEEADAARRSLRHRLLLISCWLASNFPDLDIVLSPLLPPPLGYLLHHRGHTHTLLYALPQALLIGLMTWLFWPAARRLLKDDSSARKGFALALGLGFGLHILMDYLNSYGIHPFHPFDSRWFFGDMIFILEPLFWVAFGVPMAMTVELRWLKILFIALLAGAPLFFTIKGYLPWASLAALVVIAFVLAAMQHGDDHGSDKRGRTALGLAAITSMAFIGMQSFASGQARLLVAQALKHKDAQSRILDASLTSFPTNPFCWTFVSVESNEGAGTYRLRRGQLSLAPDLMPVAECPASLSEIPAQEHASSSIAFLLEEEGDLGALRELEKDNCHFEAWLRFARAPSVTDAEASDLRFSASPRGNFTTMRFEEFRHRECPRHVPKWDFPRTDLLTPASR